MPYPNNYPEGPNISPGILVGRGGETDQYQDSTKAGNFQVALIGRHNYPQGVPIDHLALSTKGVSPTAAGQCTFAGQPDYGTIVYGYHQTGRNDIIGSFLPNEVNGSGGTPGNMNLMQAFQELMSKKDGRMSPPDYEETVRAGAKVRKPKNKGEWMHNLTKGLATHIAMPEIAGIRIPQLSNIPTAKQAFTDVLTGNILNMLPGIIMTPDQFANNIISSNSTMQTITSEMEPDIVNALTSVLTLIQSGSHIAAGDCITGIRVCPETLSNNAIKLYSQCKTVSDILYVTEELMTNTVYHGLETLDTIRIETETAFGNTVLILNADGTTSSNTSNTVIENMNNFQNMMGDYGSFPNSKLTENLFGQSSGTMFDLFKRIFPGNVSKELSEKLNTGADAKKIWKKVIEEVLNGGNIFKT